MCGFEAAAEGGFVHVVREDPLAVDLHDRQPLTIRRLQLGIPGDVDLLEGDAALHEHGARPLAEVAARAVIDRNSRARGKGHA